MKKRPTKRGGNDGVPLLLLWSFFIPFLELDKEEHSKCQVFLAKASAKCVGREKCPVAFFEPCLRPYILVVVDDDGDPFAAVSGWMEPWAPLTDCCLVGATWQETGSKTFAGCCWLLLIWPFSYSISIHFYTHAVRGETGVSFHTSLPLTRLLFPKESAPEFLLLLLVAYDKQTPPVTAFQSGTHQKSRNLIYCPWWHVSLGLFHQKFRQVQKTLATFELN